MCGIVGYSGSDATPNMAAALLCLAHRGPDDSGSVVFDDAGVVLGHTRLSIVDLSVTGSQPMTSDDGRITIVYNGELYDLDAHRRRLTDLGIVLRGSSDTEVLLRVIENEGLDAVRGLNGIFAFALFDRASGELTIVRDGLGVKPLYYAFTDTGFYFASEIKGLVSLGITPEEVDVEAVNRYLTYLWCPGEGTPVRNIRKLEPGHAMTVARGVVKQHWAWHQSPSLTPKPVVLRKREAIEQTRVHLRTAVHRQMVADVPVGAFLSGGLDSSSIVHFAREINPNIHCFTIDTTSVADEGQGYDLPYARSVARHMRVPLDVVEIDSAQMARDLEGMVAQLDEPLADPAALNVLYIARLARARGIKVLLSGAGGDDIFTGYRRHWAVQLEGLVNWAPKAWRMSLEDAAERMNVGSPVARRFSKFFAGISLDGDERIANYFAWARPRQLQALYTADFREAIRTSAANRPMIEFLELMPNGSLPLDRMLALEQRFFLGDHNLTYTDKMSMAAGVEVRVPFLDPDLVKFASSLPPDFKQRGRIGKWVLRKAMEGRLPDDIIYRPKSGFGAPLRRWIRHELAELVGDLLSRENLNRRGLFNPAAVEQMVRDNHAGTTDSSYTILSLMCIELWFRTFNDSISLNRTSAFVSQT